MTLLDSLLDAILRLDGEALIMHAGEKPYVVLSSVSMSTFRGPLSWGQVELSSRPLTADAVLGMLTQMLSAEQSHALDDLGAIEQEIDAPGDSGERFVVTAARGGDDVWVEVRRRAKIVEAPAAPPEPEASAAAPVQPEAAAEPEPPVMAELAAEREPEPEPIIEIAAQDDDVHEITAVDADLSGFDDEMTEAPVFEIASTPSFTIQTEASRVPDEGEQEAPVFEIESDGALLEISSETAAAAPVAQEQVTEPLIVEQQVEIAEQQVGEIAERQVAEIAEQRVTAAAERQVAEIAGQRVTAAAAQRVGEIAEQRVTAAAERQVAEIAGQRVTAAAAQRVGEIAEQKVTAAAERQVAEIAGQRVTEVAEQRVTVAAEQKVGEIADQRVAQVAERQVAEIAGRRVTEFAEQQVAEIAGRRVREVAEQRVTEIAGQKVAELAAQKIAEIAEQRFAELAAQKIGELAERKIAELAEQRVAEIAGQKVLAVAEPEIEAAPVVVPHARPAFKLHQPSPAPPTPDASKEASLIELLRAAFGHGASTVYAVVDTRPMMRVEGKITLVGTQPSIAAGDVERFIFEFAPREHVGEAAPEWTCTVPDVGRVRCVSFHDHSGAGLIFHLPAGDVSTAEELGIPEELQALASEADGLVVVAGTRSSGKSTLLGAFVDLINRTRYDHVITIESQIRKVHDKRLSFISQREVRGDGDAIAAAARAALREGPDVLVIEDLQSPEALIVALDAARAGRLVFGSISARTAPAAIQRLIDAIPADRRPQVRASLGGSLRAVIAQLLVPKAAGGRIAAREVLLSSPAVRKLVLDGAIDQLPIAIESGRGLGMKTMVDSLGVLVRDGVVDLADACACAPDRAALISALERDGIDVTGVERRA